VSSAYVRSKRKDQRKTNANAKDPSRTLAKHQVIIYLQDPLDDNSCVSISVFFGCI
jgi:hypothetical protein